MFFWILARIRQPASGHMAARFRAAGPGPDVMVAGPRRTLPPPGNRARMPGRRCEPPLPPVVTPPGVMLPGVPAWPDMVIMARLWGTR
jgi:hypothetical protein